MKNVLIIDDNTEFVELVEMTLSRDYNVTSCNSLEDIDCLREEAPYDVILSDYNLSFHQGKEIIDALKNKINISDSKIILVSGSTDLKETYSDLGMDDYLEKPFKMKELKEKINQLVS